MTIPALPSVLGELHRLVHKTEEAAALVCGWSVVADRSRFLVDVDWSVGRTRIFSASDSVDVIAAAETVRQIAVMLSHSGFGVPLASAFVMAGLTSECDEALHLVSDVDRGSVRADVQCSDVTLRGGALDTMTVQVTFAVRGVAVARGVGQLRVLPMSVYRRLRGGSLPVTRTSARRTMSPEEVGQSTDRDVVVGRDGRFLRLVVDTTHRGLYDHPHDHIPGMAVIEACRQVAVWRAGRQPTAMRARFHAYLELDPDPFISAECSAEGTHIAVTQNGLTAATVTFS